jgi:hypothetical protein
MLPYRLRLLMRMVTYLIDVQREQRKWMLTRTRGLCPINSGALFAVLSFAMHRSHLYAKQDLVKFIP